jgi:hypothetical protein
MAGVVDALVSNTVETVPVRRLRVLKTASFGSFMQIYFVAVFQKALVSFFDL